MEEKLNMIFEKLLDIEEQLNSQKLMQEHKKAEITLKEAKKQIEELWYRGNVLKERRAEEMCVFRNTGKQKQVEEN